jgi:hypothetical protein
MLTTDGMVEERLNRMGAGIQRIYRWGQYGLSLVDSPLAHAHPFAWEAAVLKFAGPDDHNGSITYTTALTTDLVVFATDDEANKFIAKAKALFAKER